MEILIGGAANFNYLEIRELPGADVVTYQGMSDGPQG